MTTAQRAIDVARFREGKLTSRCHDTPLTHDHSHVVQRGAGPEDRLQQLRRDHRIQADPRLRHRTHLGAPLHSDQRADFLLGQALDGRDHRVDDHVRASEPPLNPAPLPHPEQQPTQLHLKGNQRDQKDAEDEIRIQHVDALKLEAFGDQPHDGEADGENGQHGPDQACTARTLQETQHGVHDESDQEQLDQHDPRTLRDPLQNRLYPSDVELQEVSVSGQSRASVSKRLWSARTARMSSRSIGGRDPRGKHPVIRHRLSGP